MNIPYLATAIGSFPYDSADRALDIIFDAMPDAPVWPQLPRTALNEQMEIQYSEGMPRAVVDGEKGRLYFDTTGDYSEEFAQFYEIYMTAMDPDGGTGDCSALAISPEYSRGIYALEARLKKSGKKLPFVKVHTTGPCSFALTVVDENKRAIYYNEEFRDVVVKALAMKCRWQIQKFAPFAEKVICFIDEPILSAFGSSTYISVKREDVVAHINELVEAIHADGGIAGVHCCGNTDWSILIDAGVDMVNFDAYEFGETIALYPDAMKSFIARGGILAWGIVPTSVKIRGEDAASLALRYDALAENLSKKAGIDRAVISSQTVVTPSCGTGSMEIADAEKVFSTLRDLSAALKAR
ncbi:MAG TPA: hypothetical protein PKY31_09335 [Spirochaetota bacterium]|mgnify:CR=1 FL=1|nr:hypothetical protein [Spirochaetota bacterium]